VHIPLDSEELDAEVRKYVAKLAESMTPEQRAQYTEEMQKRGMEHASPYRNEGFSSGRGTKAVVNEAEY